MFHLKTEMTTEIKSNLRGGVGDLQFLHLFSGAELGGRADMFAVVTLQPGQSIGEHPHSGNGEAYLILTGSATVTEDGVARILNPGDAEFCADGHTHSIVNHTDETATFLALIMKDR